MIRRPPRSTRTDTLFPYTTLFRSLRGNGMTKQKQSRVRHQVDRRSLAEEIRDSLRERIVVGEFRDGDALIQELVAEEYGASRFRSEERRVGKECVSTCSSRWRSDHVKKRTYATSQVFAHTNKKNH